MQVGRPTTKATRRQRTHGHGCPLAVCSPPKKAPPKRGSQVVMQTAGAERNPPRRLSVDQPPRVVVTVADIQHAGTRSYSSHCGDGGRWWGSPTPRAGAASARTAAVVRGGPCGGVVVGRFGCAHDGRRWSSFHRSPTCRSAYGLGLAQYGWIQYV